MNALFNYSEWPWSGNSDKFPDSYKGIGEWPKVSVIIPSFNQGAFLEETILSVIKQNYPRIELIIIDGGSTDNSVEIIKKYQEHVAYWTSEKDRGQSDAINKGLRKCTGDWVGWLNSDDCYLQNAFQYLFNNINIDPYDFVYGNYLTGESLRSNRKIRSIGGKMTLNKILRFFYSVDYIIPSQSVFFKKALMDKVGYLDEELHYCMDLDWYARMIMKQPKVYKYEKIICFFRYNKQTKTGSLAGVDSSLNKMGQEAEKIAMRYFPQLGLLEKISFKNLFNFYLMYSKEPQKYEKSNLGYLLKVLFRHPFMTVRDRRLLGLFKRKLLPMN